MDNKQRSNDILNKIFLSELFRLVRLCVIAFQVGSMKLVEWGQTVGVETVTG